MAAPKNDMEQRLWQVLSMIPQGCVVSYGDAARLAGFPGAARSVGRVLRDLPAETELPWHRVITTKGEIALPRQSNSWREQQQRLKAEGVTFEANGTVDMKKFRWQPGA